METLVSICLPNYNYERFIKEAIDSVLAQTYTNFELIIADNASTDNSVEIIKSYNDSRIKFYQNKSNIPLYENLNKYVNTAEGELLAILHSDDKYEPNFLEEIISAYEQNPDCKVFVTGVNVWHSDENRINPMHPFISGGIKSQQEVLMRLSLENNIGNGVNVVLHRDCLDNGSIFTNDYKYAADYDLWLRLAERSNFVYIPKILAYYRIHGSNLSHTVNKNLDMFKEGLNIFEKNLASSALIPHSVKYALSYLQLKSVIHKAFDMGIKYKSGKLSRNMLEYIKESSSDLKFDLDWYLTYILTYLINEKLSDKIISLVAFLGKITLYTNKSYVNKFLERLIADIREINKIYGSRS